MYKNLSPQTKSFIILIAVAFVGTYLTVAVSQSSLDSASGGSEQFYYPAATSSPAPKTPAAAAPKTFPAVQPVSTQGWKTYADKTYPFSFSYDPAWTVKPGIKQNDFYILQIDPGPKYYNIKIYISPSQFYGLDGLPNIQTDVNGAKAFDVSNLLYGIKMGPYYYTFDNGLSTVMINEFNALVHTVKFN